MSLKSRLPRPWSLSYSPLRADVTCLPDSPLTAEELSDYRGLEGRSSGSPNTRPDFAVHASKGAQCMAKATIRDALTLNRYAADIKSSKDRGLVFRRNIVDLSLGTATIIVSYGDASFASSEGEKSQHGEIIMLTHEPDKLLSGHFELGHLISYKSGTIKRAVRSTLASEAYSISEAAEQAEWIRHVLHELHTGPSISLREVEATACSRPRVHRRPQLR